ncbi:MAG TPA: polyprenyl synthetase family protein [Candidatus Kapabacteria bacterium]|nr:polyprenyl synthetase family protein [Candidatus Kapabacteria bacterium]
MEFSETYKQLLKMVEGSIQEKLPQGEPKNLYEPFSYIMNLGGKRIRPVLCLICCGVVNGTIENALNSSVALEFLHNFTLVHDDIMDNSLIRRSQPTVHTKWNNAIAILTGDVMIGYAYRLLPNKAEHTRADEIFNLFTNELIEVCEGQVLDIDFNERKDITLEQYINMIDKKTARLIETSAAIGANIGYGSDDEIYALRKITKLLGLAFQIQDDLLDMTAEQSKLGKKIGNDLLEGKKTFLIIKLKDAAKDQQDIAFVNSFYANNGLKEQDIPIMDNLFKKYGIYMQTEQMINSLIDDALSYFTALQDNDYKSLLKQLINEVRNRNF